jgi:quercetin 2,3-dioxygenase
MIYIRPSGERGATEIDWLRSKHSFSFAEYYDPHHMGFGPLRVINEDTVAPGAGFPTHAHRDMEIVSYVLSGELEHKDSLGTGSIIRPGEVQRMSAGTGIRHSEFNPSPVEPVHFLQIWLLPERQGINPGYEQQAFADEALRNRLALVASRDGRDGALTIHRDVDLYATRLSAGASVEHAVRSGRGVWIQVAQGSVVVNGHALAQGDGAAIAEEEAVGLSATEFSEILLFDMAL